MMIRCTNEKWAHWGTIFEKDKEYNFEYTESKKVRIINNYEKYWYYNGLIAGSRDWIRKGYTQETLHEVIPGYLKHNELQELYTIEVDLPFINVKGDDNANYRLITLTKEEIVSQFNITLNEDKVPFCYSYYLVEEYFDFAQIRRDNKLKELGI